MSTRSGKRIHSSFHEASLLLNNNDVVVQSERKTRSRRVKENIDDTVVLTKQRTRKNYVSFPADIDPTPDKLIVENVEIKPLKEHNLNVTSPITDGENNPVKSARQTRRTKKMSENIDELVENAERSKKSKKKSKKKKLSKSETSQNPVVEVSKKSKKKRKGKHNTIDSPSSQSNTINKSNESVDSFHSAAGSPSNKLETKPTPNTSFTKSRRGPKRIHPDSDNTEDELPMSCSKKPKLSVNVVTKDSPTSGIESHGIKDSFISNSESNDIQNKNSTFDKSNEDIEELSSSRRKSKRNSTFEKSCTPKLNSTFDKNTSMSSNEVRNTRISLKSSFIEETTNNMELNEPTHVITKQSLHNSTFDKDCVLNSTYEKASEHSPAKTSLISLDGTINVTFDKSNDSGKISVSSDESAAGNIVNTTPMLIESSMEETNLSKLSSQLNISLDNSTNKTDLSITPDKAIKENTTVPALNREGTFTKDDSDIGNHSKTSLEKTPAKNKSLPTPGCTPFHVTNSSQRRKSMLNVTRSIEKDTHRRRSSMIEPVPRLTKVMFCSPVNDPVVVMQQKRKVIKSNLKGSNKSFVFDDSVSLDRPVARKRSATQDPPTSKPARQRTNSAIVKLSDPATPSKKSTPKAKQDQPSRTKLPNFAAMHQRRFAKMESLDECQTRKAKRAKQLLTPTGAVTVLERSSPRNGSKCTTTEAPKQVKEQAKRDTPTKTPKLPTLASLRPGFTRFGFRMNAESNPFSIPPKSEAKANGSLKRPTADIPFSVPPKLKAKPNGSKRPAERNPFSMPPKSETKSNGSLKATKADCNQFSVPPKTETKPNNSLKRTTADTNLFSVPPKRSKPHEPAQLKRQPTFPSLTGNTVLRKDVAKQTVMREKSFTSLSNRRNVSRNENRTVIKGVRTNRRFELQMMLRNIN